MGDLGLLGMGMPRSPEEYGLLMNMQQVRGMDVPMSAGQAMPYRRDMFGRVPAGAFGPNDMFRMAGTGLNLPGALGRGMMLMDPAERMFAPSLWSIVRGL